MSQDLAAIDLLLSLAVSDALIGYVFVVARGVESVVVDAGKVLNILDALLKVCYSVDLDR